ncbi:chalcone isomerase family protein [Glaciimonas sp. GG7]
MIRASARRTLLLGYALMFGLLSNVGATDMVTNPPAPPHIQNVIANARLAGQGRYTWFGISIYTAQLWVGDKGYQAAVSEAASYALDLRYDRALNGEKIAQASIEQMRKTGMGSAAQYATWLTQMKAIFPNVVDGSHLTGIFLPGQGARFYMNGKVLGDIPDQTFSDAFFGIWLSPKTTDPTLRKQLLTDAAPMAPRP